MNEKNRRAHFRMAGVPYENVHVGFLRPPYENVHVVFFIHTRHKMCTSVFHSYLKETKIINNQFLNEPHQDLGRWLHVHKTGLSAPHPRNITDRSKTVLMLWFTLFVYVRPLSVGL